MNEDKTRELLRESLLKTSDGFTDELMRKVEVQKLISKRMNLHFRLAGICCIALLLLTSLYPSAMDQLEKQINLSPTAMRIVTLLISLLLLHKLIRLRSILLKV